MPRRDLNRLMHDPMAQRCVARYCAHHCTTPSPILASFLCLKRKVCFGINFDFQYFFRLFRTNSRNTE
ncbi:hypothetical protein RHMOL_Rhmol02G0018600 [Rhododendron molle]|uniref:Uncharacterized protein n=1 Tax=Rhododendron molle TaxID=49168 RepID=A0ACC0PKI1_RHOML|nr:hypothetical protein RHMOL_Rhmol02G0018600 [Rhododendron molle]